MTDNEFDDILKKRLRSHESIVPADMWQKIFSKKRKKRPVFWWFVLMFVFMGLATYYLLMINTTKESGPGNNKNSVQKEKKIAEKKNFDNTTNLPGNFKRPVENIIDEIKSKSPNHSYFTQTSNTILTDSGSTSITPNDLFNSSLNKKDSSSDVEIVSHQTRDSVQTKPSIPNDTTQENNDAPQEESFAEKNKDENDKWFIEIFASPAFPFNRLRSPDLTYERYLKNALSTRMSFGFGANIGYQVNKSLAIKTGVYFIQLNEQYSFPDSVLSEPSVVKNRYSFVGVPLLVTLNKEFSSGFRASLTAGAVVNISNRYKGIIPSPFGGTLNIKDDDVYNSNAAADLYVGLSLSKHLNNKIALYAEPYLRYQLKNMTTGFQSFDHRINIIGLSVGLRHYLFNANAK